jgi:hypothetical protein
MKGLPALLNMYYILPGDAYKGIVIGPVADERPLSEVEVAHLKALFGSDELGIGQVYRVQIAPHPEFDEMTIEVIWPSSVQSDHQRLLAMLPKVGEWLASRH